MDQKQLATLNIIISVIFAIAIIVTTALYPESHPTSTYILVALWFIPYSWLSVQGAKLSNK